ncbi:MAG: triose-phosphate isomerase [Terriglobales bacterium]
MTRNHRRLMMVANWKMHKNSAQAGEFFQRLRALRATPHTGGCFVIVAPPYPALPAVTEAARGEDIAIAAQNLHWESEGAFTGEVSGPMLAAAGCTYVIVGHSERRLGCGETDEQVHKKVRAALAAKLTPIVCVGETEEQRSANETELILRYQFERAFWGMAEEELRHSVLAYEPVWAIGTGNTASPEVAEGAHRFLRRCAEGVFGPEAAAGFTILYGGSIQPSNIRALLELPDVDGGLVGAASLEPESFAALVRAADTVAARATNSAAAKGKS